MWWGFYGFFFEEIVRMRMKYIVFGGWLEEKYIEFGLYLLLGGFSRFKLIKFLFFIVFLICIWIGFLEFVLKSLGVE